MQRASKHSNYIPKRKLQPFLDRLQPTLSSGPGLPVLLEGRKPRFPMKSLIRPYGGSLAEGRSAEKFTRSRA